MTAPTRRLLSILILAAVLVGVTWVGREILDGLLILQLRGGVDGNVVLDFDTETPAPFPPLPPGEVDNVILLIGDGMGVNHVAAARNELVGPAGRLSFERFPTVGWLSTFSPGNLYTDSAAAATMLATGYKAAPGVLSMTEAGTPRRTLLEAARGAGLDCALVTDSYLWDATLGAFAAHVTDRDDFEAVVAGMAQSGAVLLAGDIGSQLGFSEVADSGYARSFRASGYRVATLWGELEAAVAEGVPAVGLFERGQIAAPDLAPTLPQLAELALERLAGRDTGFFLVVETEETDSGAHRQDLARVVRGVAALDAVTQLAVDFARRDGSTLVVVTADHDTGGLSILRGRQGGVQGARWTSTQHTAASVPLYAYGPGAERLGGVRDSTDVAWIVAELWGVELAGSEGAPARTGAP